MRGKRAIALGMALALLPATAHAADQLSVTKRLKDRRAVAAGTRAYSTGFEDGRFYANGWHITGEMGGIWAPPLKLADGIWFGVDDDWVGPATKFTSGRGYVRYALPPLQRPADAAHRLRPRRRARRALRARAGQPDGAAKTVTVKVDVHSELMGAYPWALRPRPTAGGNLPTSRRYENNGLTFTDRGTLPGGRPHDYTALVASTRAPDAGETGPGFRGPQPGAVCKDGDKSRRPASCDDGPLGKGAGGQLRYRVTLGSRTAQTRVDRGRRLRPGVADAEQELATALVDPDAQLAAKIAERDELAARSQVDLPGDRKLQDARRLGQAEPRRPHADRDEHADPLRRPGQGVSRAGPQRQARDVHRRRLPRLPVDVRHRRRVHGVRGGRARPVRGDQEPPAARCATISDDLNANSGKVAHEIVTDGSVYFGANTDPGNTDETAKFPCAVALVWRWTGDDRFRDRLYDFSRRATEATSPASSTPTRTAGPRASATSSARAWARRSSTTPST